LSLFYWWSCCRRRQSQNTGICSSKRHEGFCCGDPAAKVVLLPIRVAGSDPILPAGRSRSRPHSPVVILRQSSWIFPAPDRIYRSILFSVDDWVLHVCPWRLRSIWCIFFSRAYCDLFLSCEFTLPRDSRHSLLSIEPYWCCFSALQPLPQPWFSYSVWLQYWCNVKHKGDGSFASSWSYQIAFTWVFLGLCEGILLLHVVIDWFSTEFCMAHQVIFGQILLVL
jgi:hypothetical protein